MDRSPAPRPRIAYPHDPRAPYEGGFPLGARSQRAALAVSAAGIGRRPQADHRCAGVGLTNRRQARGSWLDTVGVPLAGAQLVGAAAAPVAAAVDERFLDVEVSHQGGADVPGLDTQRIARTAAVGKGLAALVAGQMLAELDDHGESSPSELALFVGQLVVCGAYAAGSGGAVQGDDLPVRQQLRGVGSKVSWSVASRTVGTVRFLSGALQQAVAERQRLAVYLDGVTAVCRYTKSCAPEQGLGPRGRSRKRVRWATERPASSRE